MGARRLVTALAAVLIPIALAACGQVAAAPAPGGTVARAPEGTYAVGVRTLLLHRGTTRPLPTIVWYPAAGPAGRAPQRDAPIAAGRFPLVLFSHGLHGLPTDHTQFTTRWARAGFVVAAPAYPYTNRDTRRFDRRDVRNQPADALHVIRWIGALAGRRGDPFAGRLDSRMVAAVGHSAGGFTTAGLFTAGHSERLRAGIVIAGGMRDIFAGPPAALLFVHGAADPTVPVATGRSAYDKVPWPKAFLTLVGQGHGEYLTPGRAGFDQTAETMTDFLRWTLYGDAASRDRIPDDARRPGVTELSGRI